MFRALNNSQCSIVLMATIFPRYKLWVQIKSSRLDLEHVCSKVQFFFFFPRGTAGLGGNQWKRALYIQKQYKVHWENKTITGWLPNNWLMWYFLIFTFLKTFQFLSFPIEYTHPFLWNLVFKLPKVWSLFLFYSLFAVVVI